MLGAGEISCFSRCGPFKKEPAGMEGECDYRFTPYRPPRRGGGIIVFNQEAGLPGTDSETLR